MLYPSGLFVVDTSSLHSRSFIYYDEHYKIRLPSTYLSPINKLISSWLVTVTDMFLSFLFQSFLLL